MAHNVKNPGLNRHARALGISPGHLSQVVNGSRKSPELLARYRALLDADPDGTKGVKVSFLPAGTQIGNCTPEQLAAAKEFGALVTVEGTTIELLEPFTFALGGAGPAIVSPASMHPAGAAEMASPAPNAAPLSSPESGTSEGDKSPTTSTPKTESVKA